MTARYKKLFLQNESHLLVTDCVCICICNFNVYVTLTLLIMLNKTPECII